jgi:hypothetical protein
MKSVSEVLHRTPWWVLLASGLALAIGLALFVTPFHLINLGNQGATPEERRAIKHEVDLTFSEGAIDIARGVVREMRKHAKDPVRQEELDEALEQIEQARTDIREAGADVLRAKREAAEEIANAARDTGTAASEAARVIAQAQRTAAEALQRAGVDPTEVNRKLEEAARKAEEDAKRAKPDAEPQAAAKPVPEASPAVPVPQAAPAEPAAPGTPEKSSKRRIVIMGPGHEKPLVDLDLTNAPNAAGGAALAPLTPAERAQIREKVTGDLWRIGVGAGLILIFIPLFILTVVSKFFIDRSRAAQRLAELKRKEAEYHRMSQQVTEAKLSALQAQVEPHFLYNTLASVQALTEVDPQRANEMTGHLIQYLRNALPKMRESVSTVGQEVELVRAYLNILQMRMGKRLTFAIEVPPELNDLALPPLMLPSLVENAIKHGLEPQREGGEVRISAELVGETLRVVVADTGRGFGETVGAGVGLANIRERLAAMYGDRARLTLDAREPRGVVATIELPRNGARAAAAAMPQEMPEKPTLEIPKTRAARTLAAMGTAERAWRKGLSFTFVVLVVVAAVFAGLGILGVATGVVHIDGVPLVGTSGAVVGAAGIAAAFAVVVLALAIVLAVVYGLGFLFVGLAIFIPLVVLVSVFPSVAPFLLVGLVVWWLVRRHDRRKLAREAQAAQ